MLVLSRNKIRKKRNKKLKEIGRFLTKEKGQITNLNKKSLEIKKGIKYHIPKNSKMKLNTKDTIEKNTTIYKIEYEKEKTKDIIEGLPKIEEILEIKKTRNLKKITKNPHNKLKKIFAKYSKKYTNKIANRKSINKIQTILLKQIQKVYLSQGVNISEKHISLIIKQITSSVIIKNRAQTKLMEGEILNINKVEKFNTLFKEKIEYEPILIGISKISLINESFISAACFQETIKILNKSAISGKIDWLVGLKENIIIGNLIPAGTGKTC